jgi:hypothetical protein
MRKYFIIRQPYRDIMRSQNFLQGYGNVQCIFNDGDAMKGKNL